MNTSSAKAKGRRLQQWVASQLISRGLAEEGDVESRPMGSGGEDVIIGNNTRRKFPYSVECKNTEKVNVWQAYEQASENSKGYEPIAVLKRNKSKFLVVVDARHFFLLVERAKWEGSV